MKASVVLSVLVGEGVGKSDVETTAPEGEVVGKVSPMSGLVTELMWFFPLALAQYSRVVVLLRVLSAVA